MTRHPTNNMYTNNQWVPKSDPNTYIVDGVTYTEITATRNESNFNSIREIINSIVDATSESRYTINIPNGEWFECDINGKEYITIRGENKYKTILYCDGTSSNLSPIDYSFSGYENTPLSSIPQTYKHVIMALDDLIVENLTLTGDVIKYPFHADTATDYTVIFLNCIFTTIKPTATFFLSGIGLHGIVGDNQRIIFDSCSFVRKKRGKYAIYIHNWNNQLAPASVLIKNCQFENCGFLLTQELGSEQTDEIEIDNCTSDYGCELFYGTLKDYYLNESDEHISDALDLPYNINISIANSNPKIYPWNEWEPNVNKRPDYMDYITIT